MNSEDTPRKVVVEGLLPLPEDKRDFKHSQVFGAPPVNVPLVDFDTLSVVQVKNQYNTDFCAGFSSSSINEDIQNGKVFCPLYQFSKIKQVQGEYRSWGADLRSTCKALTKYGSLPLSLSPYNIDPSNPNAKEREFVANWTNWPAHLDINAGEWKCGSFFAVDGSGDMFDNGRALMWQNKDARQGIEFGVMWRPEWTYAPNGVIPEANYTQPAGGGHALKACGQKVINGFPYWKVQNSWGDNFGDKGFYYFPRSVINLEAKTFGAYMLKDMDAETAKRYIDYHLTTQDGMIGMVVKIILTIFRDFKSLLS